MRQCCWQGEEIVQKCITYQPPSLPLLTLRTLPHLPTAAACGVADENSNLQLSCDSGTFTKVLFASFGKKGAMIAVIASDDAKRIQPFASSSPPGTPNGTCASGFEAWNCSSPNSMEVVEHACLGKSECTVRCARRHGRL